MNTLPRTFPRIPLKTMDPALLWFELDRETQRLMPQHSELITSAATMAGFAHRNQTRFVRGPMERVPYIEHPLRVALRLLRWGITDGELIATALLHDVAEDCADEVLQHFGLPTEDIIEALSRMYGPAVGTWVAQLTNPSGAGSSQAGAREVYAQHIADLAETRSMALLVKASDLKDNAGSIRHQLGHGKDAKMLRMLTKYLPTLEIVIDALEIMAEDPVCKPAASRAADELRSVRTTLRQIAQAHT